MNEQDALLERSPQTAVRTLALRLLDEAAAAATRLGSETDVEALHDCRVALRRLRTLLRSYRGLLQDSVPKKLARALRDLAASTGGARDAEVQLEWLADKREALKPAARKAWSWLVARLEERRKAAYSSVRGETRERFTELETRLRSRLSHYRATITPDAPRATFAEAVAESVRSTSTQLAGALDLVRSSTDVEEAHRARILGKRLRYLIEPLRTTSLGEPAERLVDSIKTLQDVLGRMHDMHVLAAEISESLVEAAAERARKLHEALYSSDPSPLERDLRSGILAIDRLVRDQVEVLYQELRARWPAERVAALVADVDTLAAALIRRGEQGRGQRIEEFPDELGPEAVREDTGVDEDLAP